MPTNLFKPKPKRKSYRAASSQREMDGDVRFFRAIQKSAQNRKRAKDKTAARIASAQSSRPVSAVAGVWKSAVFQRWLFRSVAVIALISVIANILMYSRYSPSRTMVTVAGTSIPLRTFQISLENAAGQQVLQQMVVDQLVTAAAQKNGLNPTPDQIDTEIQFLKRESPSSLPPQAQLYQATQLQMEVNNLRTQGISASPAQVAAFYNAHKNLFTVPANVQLSLVATNSAANASKAKSMLESGQSEQYIANQPNMQVAGINNVNFNLNKLPTSIQMQIRKDAQSLPLLQAQIIPVAQGVYLILMPRSRTPANTLTLNQALPEATMLTKLQFAPTEAAEILKLYKQNPPTFNMPRYAQYLSNISTAAEQPIGGAPAKTVNGK